MDHYTPIAIRVEDLWVVKEGGWFSNPKSLLQDVHFTIEPGQFVGVVGPNGAGKTTLLKALVGERPASGRILLQMGDTEYEDLYDNPEYWLKKIGYVPVDNVLHDDLTVLQALMHVGRLRLPDMDEARILKRVQLRLGELGFDEDDERLYRFIKNLSSGERKKVNIAAELLTNPPLLLLDEPTSNLDPNAERDLMDNLKRLAGSQNAGNGPTILLITHTLDTLNRCDYVLFIENSRLRTSGTEQEVFNELEQNILTRGGEISQSSHIFEHWAVIFDAFKTGETANRNQAAPKRISYSKAAKRRTEPDSFWRQFRILFKRYFLMRYNDLSGIVAMLVAAFIAGFLLLIAPSEIFLEASDASGARQTVVLYVILVVITAAFISHREVSKEFRIYIHERAKGLNPLAYLLSKTVWLTVVIGIFSPLMILSLSGTPFARILTSVLGIALFLIGVVATLQGRQHGKVLSNRERLQRIIQLGFIALPLIAATFVQLQHKQLPTFPIDGLTVELIVTVTLILTSVAALTMGLMISAIAGSNNDRATQLAIGVIIINVILAFSVLVIGSPEFQGLFDTLEPFAATHWGYRGFSSSISIYCWAGQPRFENFNSGGNIFSAWLLLIVHIFVAIGLGSVFLRLQETWTTPAQVLRKLTVERVTVIFVLMVVGLISWNVFLTRQSWNYYELTFFDRFYGGNRYADGVGIENATPVQLIISNFSSSPCGVPSASDIAYRSKHNTH